MDEQGRGSWKRRFNMYAPLAAVAVGLIIVLSSLLVENMTAWYEPAIDLGSHAPAIGRWQDLEQRVKQRQQRQDHDLQPVD